MNKAILPWLLTIMLIACARTPGQTLTNDEIDLLKKELADGATPQQACNELDVLCEATGFGCKAHAAFCDVPTKAYICQQLAAACLTYPAACAVFDDHCEDVSVEDGGTGETVPAFSDGATDSPVDDLLKEADQSAKDSSSNDQGVMACHGSDQTLLDTSPERVAVLIASWSCMMGCLASNPADVMACSNDCLVQQTGLTPGCAHCVSKTSECQIAHCTNECSALESADYRDCSWNSGCDEIFHGCTGLPPW